MTALEAVAHAYFFSFVYSLAAVFAELKIGIKDVMILCKVFFVVVFSLIKLAHVHVCMMSAVLSLSDRRPQCLCSSCSATFLAHDVITVHSLVGSTGLLCY